MNLDSIPDWVAWLAQDADGALWGYEVEPNMQHNGWYETKWGELCDWAKRSRRQTGRRP